MEYRLRASSHKLDICEKPYMTSGSVCYLLFRYISCYLSFSTLCLLPFSPSFALLFCGFCISFCFFKTRTLMCKLHSASGTYCTDTHKTRPDGLTWLPSWNSSIQFQWHVSYQQYSYLILHVISTTRGLSFYQRRSLMTL